MLLAKVKVFPKRGFFPKKFGEKILTFFWHSSTKDKSVRAIGGMGGGGIKKSGGASSRKAEHITGKKQVTVKKRLMVPDLAKFLSLGSFIITIKNILEQF